MPESYIALAKTLFNHTLRYMLKIYVIGIYKTMSKEAQCFSPAMTGDKSEKKHVYCCYVQASYPVFFTQFSYPVQASYPEIRMAHYS